MRRITALLLLWALFASGVLASNVITVKGLQTPAWVERSGVRLPLKPKEVLRPDDRILTSETGKVWLEMADGALVKLGNHSEMLVRAQQMSPVVAAAPSASADQAAEPAAPAEQPSSSAQLLQATLDVLEGAFRYTADALSNDWQRDVKISVVTATIGIRGTDIWGRVGDEEQFVVLLEGSVDVTPTRGNKSPVKLTQPLQIYRTQFGQAQPLLTATMDDVKKLAPQTELDYGKGVIEKGGNFALHLASFLEEQSANSLRDNLVAQGYPAESYAVRVNGERYTRVSIFHLASREDAEALGRQLARRSVQSWPEEMK